MQVLLAPGAADVVGVDRHPFAVPLLLIMTRSGIGQSLGSVQQLISGIDRQTTVGVAGRVREVEVDPADVVDQRLEADEVDLDVMVNGKARDLLHRADHQGSAAGGIGGVDPIGTLARDLDQQVSGKREDLNVPVGRIELDRA